MSLCIFKMYAITQLQLSTLWKHCKLCLTGINFCTSAFVNDNEDDEYVVEDDPVVVVVDDVVFVRKFVLC